MTAYLISLTVIVAAAFVVGWRLGRRQAGAGGNLSRPAGAIMVGLGLLWLVAAWQARIHADADGPGAALAEGFAHSGKWLVLLAAAALGNGVICGARQIPPTPGRKALYLAAVCMIAGMVVSRTVPVYFLLGVGRRDESKLMRESEQFEVSCGAVALLNYLERYHGETNLTEREVSKICGVTEEGTTTTALVRAARYFGLTNATARVLSMEDLEQARLPVIVSISTLPQVHHATLLIRLDAKTAGFIDPAYGQWSISRERFQQIWYGKTVQLE